MTQKTKRTRDIKDVAAADGRYALDAYAFIFESIEYTVAHLGRDGHITGRELSLGIRDHALEEFGGLAKLVFDQWGVHTTADFGEIVFILVEAGLMGKTDEDSRADFSNVYDFKDVFRFDGARKP